MPQTIRCLQYNTQNDGGRAVEMAMSVPPPTKPITLPDRVVLAGEEKKKSALSHAPTGEK